MRSPLTIVSYGNDLKQFFDFVGCAASDYASIRDEDIRLWIINLMDAGMKPTSVRRKLSSLKSFYAYLLSHGLIVNNPAHNIKVPKIPKPIPAFFEESQIDNAQQLIEEHTAFEAARNALIIELLYQTGLRRAELLGLKDVDIDWNRFTLRVFGKRSKERLVPFGSNLAELIRNYQQLRDDTVPRRCPNLFVRTNGTPMYAKAVYNIVVRYMGYVSTLQKHSPHVLRHTFATTMLNNGAELNAVKELMGHSSLAATEIYTHITFEQIMQLYKQAHPHAEKNNRS